MNILLTGATGFLGAHLLSELVQERYSITILKRSTSNTWRIKRFLSNCDVFDIDKISLDEVFSRKSLDVVIHTACCYGKNNETLGEIVETNVLFPLKLLELAINREVPLFINTDTFSNVPDILPAYLRSYNLSKRQFSEWLKFQPESIKIVNLKMQHIYGPNDSNTKFIYWLVQQYKIKASKVFLTEGIQKRDFVYIDDVVSAYIQIIRGYSNFEKYSEFNVGSGIKISLRHFIEVFNDIFRSINPECTTIPVFGAIPYKEGELMDVENDITALKNCGWSPETSLEEGLRKLINSIE
jgi:nucleoside-diphosphate-sugar epimerase